MVKGKKIRNTKSIIASTRIESFMFKINRNEPETLVNVGLKLLKSKNLMEIQTFQVFNFNNFCQKFKIWFYQVNLV